LTLLESVYQTQDIPADSRLSPGSEGPFIRRFVMHFDLIDKLEEIARDLPDRAQDALDRVMDLLEDHLP